MKNLELVKQINLGSGMSLSQMSVDESSTWAKEAIKKYIVNIGRQDDVQLY
jgi:hypothetical protein